LTINSGLTRINLCQGPRFAGLDVFSGSGKLPFAAVILFAPEKIHMADTPAIQNAPLILTVTPEERGMKLLRFLECRLQGHAPKSMLHKWIRTGQVRVNKGRAGPYHLLEQGDTVRMPPFAIARQVQTPRLTAEASASPDFSHFGPDLGPGLRILGQGGGYMALAKSAGLPVQPGSANTDSVAQRLRAAFVGEPFIPAPAHRLDKHTSGVLLAGKSHAAQRRLHALFRENAVRKEYLAWVPGTWPYKKAVLLRDRLEQQADASGYETMAALPGGRITEFSESRDKPGCDRGEPGLALSVVLPVCYLGHHDTTGCPPAIREATLLLVRLLTGRKHQIRVQLASRGFPIIGDARYGGPVFRPMLLHAFALALPPEGEEEIGPEWSLFPEWPASFMPDAAALEAARER
jgi:23S rRNA pseudouridine955/2504/2580 synthase